MAGVHLLCLGVAVVADPFLSFFILFYTLSLLFWSKALYHLFILFYPCLPFFIHCCHFFWSKVLLLLFILFIIVYPFLCIVVAFFSSKALLSLLILCYPCLSFFIHHCCFVVQSIAVIADPFLACSILLYTLLLLFC